MSHPSRSFPWLLRAALALVLLGGAAVPALAQDATPAADEPALLVDDAATANPDLVEVVIDDPAGLGAPEQMLMAPEGTTVSVVAAGIDRPRFMTFDDAGNLLVGGAGAGAVYRYSYADGMLGEQETLVDGLDQPASVALHTVDGTEYLYVGENYQVSRFTYDAAGPVGEQEVVVPELPTGGHNTRTVAFGPDGMMYLAVGSSCNICEEEDEIRATVARANPDGSDLQIIATGLRNAVGLAFDPTSGQLWATVNERDTLGDEIPPDFVTMVHEGGYYGWPECLPPAAVPQTEGADCSNVIPPTVGIQAHSAPLGLTFLDGEGIPADLSGDLVVVQHGSWNRSDPAEPKLLHIVLEDGQPVAAMDLVTGWQDESGERWGRSAGIVVAPDGSLIVSDDENGMIYRVTLAG
ncbi:MAG TPA: PQQ-dependent sugar dehydrogenase [Thermomicrobiales bacterium]|jgi:glucose/arabinose dehydrogenase|nr:PQQ-dependent sugar dehydrogenase [Thermomicrobiales bacterium]